MHYYLRYPMMVAAGYATFMAFSPYFFETKKPQNEYTIKDWNQDTGKLYFDMGRASQKRHDLKAAIKAYTKALEKNPYYLECYDYLGICFELCQQLDQALQTYLKAMSVNPSFVETRIKKFKTLPEVDPKESIPVTTKTKWEGQPLDNKTIYVYADGGLGDTIFFLRFLHQLLKPGTKILFKPQQELYPLLKNTLSQDITVLPETQGAQDLLFDYYISLNSVPSALKVSYTTIPARDGYLHANPIKVAALKKEIFNNTALKIGIVWQGNPEHPSDKNRSVPLRLFYPLTMIPGVKVYSLQKVYGLNQLEQLPQGVTITNLDPKLHDFDDMAAAIENLDIFISVNTSIAHLGGALGKTTWILLPHITDWRWFSYSEGTQSCWYAKVKKIRQKRDGDWQEVFERVTKQIQELATLHQG